MDVFVLGGWWGKGSRGGKISSLLFGLRNEQEKEYEGQQPTYVHPYNSLCLTDIFNPSHRLLVALQLSVELVVACRFLITNGSSRCCKTLILIRSPTLPFGRDKHGRHFIPFDRKKPPPWINFGPVGNDDKREWLCFVSFISLGAD